MWIVDPLSDGPATNSNDEKPLAWHDHNHGVAMVSLRNCSLIQSVGVI